MSWKWTNSKVFWNRYFTSKHSPTWPLSMDWGNEFQYCIEVLQLGNVFGDVSRLAHKLKHGFVFCWRYGFKSPFHNGAIGYLEPESCSMCACIIVSRETKDVKTDVFLTCRCGESCSQKADVLDTGRIPWISRHESMGLETWLDQSLGICIEDMNSTLMCECTWEKKCMSQVDHQVYVSTLFGQVAFDLDYLTS